MRDIAERQYGVISHDQLRSSGLSSTGISRRVAAGVLHRIHRGVYAVGHKSLGNEGRWLAAVLTCGDGAVLSHRSAAALWEIGPRHDRAQAHAPIDVSVRGDAGRAKRQGIRLHRSRTLRSEHCTLRRRIPVTNPARTLDDLGAVLKPAALAAAIREAEFLRLPIDPPADSSRGRTELETAFLGLCRRHRIPEPAVNTEVDRYEVDFLWPSARLIVEVDGWEAHRTRSAFEEDRARDVRLTVLGYEVVRFTWWQVTDRAAEVAKTIRALLRARA